jgi:hypothetical protein
MDIDDTIDDTHLQRRISLQVMPSYSGKRLHEQSANSEKTPHDERLSIQWSEHIAAIPCAA